MSRGEDFSARISRSLERDQTRRVVFEITHRIADLMDQADIIARKVDGIGTRLDSLRQQVDDELQQWRDDAIERSERD